MAEFKVEFFTKANGKCPVLEFIDELDVPMKAQLLRAIQVLELHGNLVRGSWSKLLGDGIFELRARSGNNISRVLYFFFVGKRIIVTNGFIKKTQKTPKQELETAKKYRAEFMERECD